MTDYAKKARDADAKLRKKGGTVTLRRIVLGDDDPDTGKPIKTVTDYTATGVKLNYEAERIDGTLIQAGDQELYLSPLQLNGQPLPAPTVGDLVLVAGVQYAIGPVQKIEPVDVPVLYIVQLKGN
ncbi:hypothetical protein GTP55_25680 [Duganella sp. FT109W]|uniref:Uncharacterized protein n=1 Tax=Duganella margarita TaxID=2692170 RepID=A0ABW9WR61_9BURK|nr:hypothetical protein [Duganella margarita]MYN42739.1 hypothetical protein [Duganella margarita]